MFYFIESIILERNIQYFINFFYDVYICTQEEYFIKLLEHYKINIENLILVFVLIYYALSLNDIKNSILKSYSILIKVINNFPDYDLGIILYLKYSIYKYIQFNEGKLYTKDFSVNLNNLLPEKYQIDGIGDWGLGIGDWGLGPIPNPQSPIPNPQSPIPNPQLNKIFFIKK